jgi:hypothetical protein
LQITSLQADNASAKGSIKEPGRPMLGGGNRRGEPDRQFITGRAWIWESEGPVVAGKRVMNVEPRGPHAERVESEEGRADGAAEFCSTKQAIWSAGPCSGASMEKRSALEVEPTVQRRAGRCASAPV